MFSIQIFKRLQQIKEFSSFAKAAEKLFVSRSALVQQVKAVEEELGFTIFLRDAKGIRLTEPGKLFLGRGEKVLSEYEGLLQKCRLLEEKDREKIIIGVMPNLKSIALSALCQQYRSEYPDSTIEFREYPPEKYFSAFSAGSFDICCEYACCYHCSDKDTKFLPLKPTKYCIAIPLKHPLARHKKISFKDLRGQKLLMYRRGITKCDDLLRDYILQNEPEIQIIDIEKYDSSLIIKCELERAVLLNYEGYAMSFPYFVSVPTNWKFKIELGIGYHSDCRAAVKNFLFEAAKYLQQHKL